MKKNNYGITLIALAVTIIIMLILAGVTISALTGNSGITTQAKHSKTKNELAAYKEQIDLFIADKKMENEEFDEESLFSGKNTLRYNTQNENETGTIKTICPQMKNDYLKRLEIKKGKAILDTKDVTEIEIARSLGINVNPYEISEDGELISSNGNLLLIDTNGTLELPDTVITIGEGAFANTASDGIVLRKVIIPYTVKEIKQNAFNGNSISGKEQNKETQIDGSNYNNVRENRPKRTDNVRNSDEQTTIKYLKEYVENNYIYDISMQEAAEEMGYSDAYFSKLFKQYFNQNFTAYLTEYRIKKAKELLSNTNHSIKDISRMVGYTDSNYFAKIFKRLVGEIPSKYRENLTENE